MILTLLVFFVSNFDCDLAHPQALNKCVALSSYIKESKTTTIGKDLSEKSVFVVLELDSCLIFSVQYNDVDMEESYKYGIGHLTKYEGDYIYIIGAHNHLLDWECLELIEMNRANIQSIIKERLLCADSLEYTTYKFPSRVIVK